MPVLEKLVLSRSWSATQPLNPGLNLFRRIISGDCFRSRAVSAEPERQMIIADQRRSATDLRKPLPVRRRHGGHSIRIERLAMSHRSKSTPTGAGVAKPRPPRLPTSPPAKPPTGRGGPQVAPPAGLRSEHARRGLHSPSASRDPPPRRTVELNRTPRIGCADEAGRPPGSGGHLPLDPSA